MKLSALKRVSEIPTITIENFRLQALIEKKNGAPEILNR